MSPHHGPHQPHGLFAQAADAGEGFHTKSEQPTAKIRLLWSIFQSLYVPDNQNRDCCVHIVAQLDDASWATGGKLILNYTLNVGPKLVKCSSACFWHSFVQQLKSGVLECFQDMEKYQMPLLSINHSCLTGSGKTDVKGMLLTQHFPISTADFNPLRTNVAI